MTDVTFAKVRELVEQMPTEERTQLKAWLRDKDLEEEALRTLPNPLTMESMYGFWKHTRVTDEDLAEASAAVTADFEKRAAE